MNAKTVLVALAALLVVALVGWLLLSTSPAPEVPAPGPGPAPAAPPRPGEEPVPAPGPGAKPAEGAPSIPPAAPREERDGAPVAPDAPPPGFKPSAAPKQGSPEAAGSGAGSRGGRDAAGGGGGTAEEGAVAPVGVTESLSEFRRMAITRALDFDAVFPGKGGWPRDDEGRLERYPAPTAWPRVLGYMETNPSRYRVVADPRKGIGEKSKGGFVLPEPLATTLTTENYVTLVCRKGIAATGIWVCNSYGSLLCQGDMAGKAYFGSYATAVIDGALSGTVTAKSYFNLVVQGAFTGKIFTESYAMVHLLGGLEGELEIKGSKVYAKGAVAKAVLEKVRGSGTLFVDESDLGPGRHALGGITVYVGPDSVPAENGK